MTDLGKVGINPRKAWVSGTTYERLDLVSHKGAAYLALKETTVEPTDDNMNWMLIAEGIDTDGVEDIVDAKIATLSDVAISGAYGDLTGAPSALPADGGNADTVDGFHASKENIVETIVVRGESGSVKVGAIISDIANDENPGISQVITTNGIDNMFRKVSLQHMKDTMGLGNIEANRLFAHKGAGAGSGSYFACMRIITKQYTSNPAVFVLSTKGNGYIKAVIAFEDSSSTDPALAYFKCIRYGTTKKLYAAKTNSNTWVIYADASNFDWISFAGIDFTGGYEKNITGMQEKVSSLPTGWIEATVDTNII